MEYPTILAFGDNKAHMNVPLPTVVRAWYDFERSAVLFSDGHRIVFTPVFEFLLSGACEVVGWWAVPQPFSEGDLGGEYFEALESYLDDENNQILLFSPEQRQAIVEARKDVPSSLKRLAGLLV